MRTRANISITTTVLNILILIPLLILFGVVLFYLNELGGVFDTAGSLLQSDGYDRVGGLSLGLIGIVGEIVLWALLFVDAITCCMVGSAVLVGLIQEILFFKKKKVRFLLDSIVKILIDGLLMIVCLISVTKTQWWWILLALIPAVCVVLSIVSLCIKTASGSGGERSVTTNE